MAHSHTLKLIPTAAAAAISDQPVDLAAKPKTAPSPSPSPTTSKPQQTTLQVPNLSGLIAPVSVASGAAGVASLTPQRSPQGGGIHTLRIPSLPQTLRPATVLPTASRATLTAAGAPGGPAGSGAGAGGAQVITAGPGLAVMGRGGGAPGAAVLPRPPAILTVPKNAAGGVNLAVVQQVPPVNKVVLQAPSPGGGKGSTIAGITQVPRGTATTIIRPPSTPYTIRAPVAAHGAATSGQPTAGTTTTAMGLTAATVAAASTPSTVQFVPVSLATSGGATLRPAAGAATITGATGATAGGLPTVSFRQGSAAIVTQRPSPAQQLDGSGGAVGGGNNAAAGTVRVTLVQSSGSISGKPTVSHATLSQSASFYKPVTITTQHPVTSPSPVSAAVAQQQQMRTTTMVPTSLTTSGAAAVTQPVRIGPLAPGTARAMLQPIGAATAAAAASSQPLTVSLTPTSHISLPLQQNLITTKQPLRFPAASVSAAGSGGGKIFQMPIVAASNAPGSGQPSGVTIQKTTIPANTIPRTISLPYGTTTQVSAIATKQGTSQQLAGAAAAQALPVAGRMATAAQQALNISSSAAGQAPNLVTITSSMTSAAAAAADGGAAAASSLPPGSVYVARAPMGSSGAGNPASIAAGGQPLAINLTNTPAKIISQGRTQLSIEQGGSSVGTSSAAAVIATSAASSHPQGGAKISLPTQPARFVALPTQPAVSAAQAVAAHRAAAAQAAAVQRAAAQAAAASIPAGGGGGAGSVPNTAAATLITNLPPGLAYSSSASMVGQSATVTSLAGVTSLTQQQQQQLQQPLSLDLDKKYSISSQPSSRPGILRRGDGDRDLTGSPTRDLDREDAGSSTSGSTTLSATSSPGGAGNGGGGVGDTVAVGEEAGGTSVAPAPGDQPSSLNPSPRKKMRKQQFTTQSWMSEELSSAEAAAAAAAGGRGVHPAAAAAALAAAAHDGLMAAGGGGGAPKRKLSMNNNDSMMMRAANKMAAEFPPPRIEKPRLSLINSYRHTWKSRHNHFLRHSDVKVKEDRRPTVNELANQRLVLQKIDGWKVYHLSSQMESIVEMETDLTKKLNGLHKRLEKVAHPDLSHKDLTKVHELIKANLQRSKVVQDQVKEAKGHALDLFEHKSKVKEIVNKYVSKRHVKKRELN